jgi:glycosyltransferase involved in cell wall biosynthesis
MDVLALPREKVMVIPRDSRRMSEPLGDAESARLLKRLGVTAPFALFPAQTFTHKNHVRLLEALALLRDRDGLVVPLVCSGRKYDPHWAPIGEALETLKLGGQVHFVGGVSDEELTALCQSARMMVFPSRFEGLGLPILEAMQFDLPIAASNASCLPEVVGAAGLLFDPDDASAIAEAVKRLWTDEALRARLVSAGRVQRAAMSWDEAALAYVAAYRHVAGRPLTADQRRRLEAGVEQ